MFARLGAVAAAAWGGGGGPAAPPSAEGLSPTAYHAKKAKEIAQEGGAEEESAEVEHEEQEEEAGGGGSPVLQTKKAPGVKKERAPAKRLRLRGKELGGEMDQALAEWVRCHLPRARFSSPLQRCPDFAARQFEKGLGATDKDDVDEHYKDPKLRKGKKPGEGEAGLQLVNALQRMGVTEVATTWSTLDRHIGLLVAEASSWFSSYGSCDKMPTGRAKTTRVVVDADTGLDETVDWPFQPWMWTFMRLGKQRAGQAQEMRVKKEGGTGHRRRGAAGGAAGGRAQGAAARGDRGGEGGR